MLREVTRPVRREPTRATASTQLQRAFQMPQFNAEPRQCRERVDDQPTAVTSVVIALVGIRLRLNRAVDADRVGDPVVLAPRMRLASLGAGRGVAERTANERLLHHSSPASASRPAVQPRWKTASCVDESNAAPLGSWARTRSSGTGVTMSASTRSLTRRWAVASSMSAVSTPAASRSWANCSFSNCSWSALVSSCGSGPGMVSHAAHAVARCTPPGADKQSGVTASVRSRVAIADDGDVVDEQDALHEVEFGQAVLVEVMPAKVVHRHHQTAELDFRPTVLLGAVPFLELEEVVADVLPLAFLNLDGDASVGVIEVDAVVKPLMRPELAVWVVAAGGVPFVLVLREPVSDFGIERPDLRVLRRAVEDACRDGFDGRLNRRHRLIRKHLGRGLGPAPA
ncbi:unknown (plasmid) [Halobacterium salinarum NRC-1]|uniref:Spurious ORF n=1 Tax=Halobacterium salinarum (strain ATCC 700922 / JCM 11081 / NRC-1) TaxID=64091 RepID=O52032_HALSA|nr:unknown [Halobacterium salinarum NRC-1]DAC79623.1 TPA_inf: spurious ORF [Halobacterium salinarum NRC-1]